MPSLTVIVVFQFVTPYSRLLFSRNAAGLYRNAHATKRVASIFGCFAIPMFQFHFALIEFVVEPVQVAVRQLVLAEPTAS